MKIEIIDIKGIFNEISDLMEENKNYLCELDGAIGDGDIGLTMARGFHAIRQMLEEEDFEDIGSLLLKSGMEMSNKSPSTMGTLIASGLLRAAKKTRGKKELDLIEFCELLQEIEEGIIERGNAKVGDKTILDALNPASKALMNAIEENKSVKKAVEDAVLAAEQGMKNTIHLQSEHGRAARYLEKSIGKQDPGATVGALVYKGIYNYLK